MSSYQFCRIESFSRAGSAKKKSGKQFKNWTASDVIAEAVRDPEHCPHVAEPQKPLVLFGSEEDLRKSLDDYCTNTKTAKGRKLRTDSLCLGSFVASYPNKTPGPDYDEWRKKTLEFVHARWGDCLRFAVEHKDESNPHCHFFLVEKPGHEFRLDPIKDAHRKATEEARALGKSDKEASLQEKNRRAIEAGEALNLDFFNAVSKHFGHFKDAGENARRRKTRDEYLAERQAVEALEKAKIQAAETIEKAKAIEQEERAKLIDLEDQRAKALATISKGKKAQEAITKANEVRKIAAAEKKEAEAIKRAVEASDPYKLRRTIGRFANQFVMRLVVFLSVILRRPRQTMARRQLLKTQEKLEITNDQVGRLRHENRRLEKEKHEHYKARKEAEEKATKANEESEKLAFELAKHTQPNTPTPGTPRRNLKL